MPQAVAGRATTEWQVVLTTPLCESKVSSCNLFHSRNNSLIFFSEQSSMVFKNLSSVCLLTLFALTMHAQAPTAPPPTAPATPTARPASDMVAGIPVNYDESKVGTYTLPDSLTLNNGKPDRKSTRLNSSHLGIS